MTSKSDIPSNCIPWQTIKRILMPVYVTLQKEDWWWYLDTGQTLNKLRIGSILHYSRRTLYITWRCCLRVLRHNDYLLYFKDNFRTTGFVAGYVSTSEQFFLDSHQLENEPAAHSNFNLHLLIAIKMLPLIYCFLSEHTMWSSVAGGLACLYAFPFEYELSKSFWTGKQSNVDKLLLTVL